MTRLRPSGMERALTQPAEEAVTSSGPTNRQAVSSRMRKLPFSPANRARGFRIALNTRLDWGALLVRPRVSYARP